MTSGQRKAHKIVWVLIAIAIPILVFFSVKNLDFSITKKKANLFKRMPNADALKTVENETFKVSLFLDSTEIIVKSTLKASSAVVYTINESGEKGNALGQVSTVGIYTFKTISSIQGIIIFDEIKEVEIIKLLF